MNDQSLKKRIRIVQAAQQPGKCVLYVMSRDQRVVDNHALIAAQKHALAKKLPLAVVFCLIPKSGLRAQEHYRFMLSGLEEVEQSLQVLSIPFMLLIGPAKQRLSALFHHVEPDAVYVDFSPLRGPRSILRHIAASHKGMTAVVDTHNVVPVWETSTKAEFGAYTIRPKLHKKLAEFLVEPEVLQMHQHKWPGPIHTMSHLTVHIEEAIKAIPENGVTSAFISGEKAAREALNSFMHTKLARYAVDRNNPASGSQSDLSPYLHFGQLSALRVALAMQDEAHSMNAELHFLHSPKMPKPEEAATTTIDGINALIEELIVRKELADNYCYYTNDYANLHAAPSWARATLNEHRRDKRQHIYSYDEFARGTTHDPAWNAAQKQLTNSGKMHGYMRMYWAKKVLEWTESPEQAIDYLIRLNDFYSIDGGDPNGYAGILWSVAGVHDRPWQEREIFGKVRYMNYEGLKRKFDIEAYCKQWQ